MALALEAGTPVRVRLSPGRVRVPPTGVRLTRHGLKGRRRVTRLTARSWDRRGSSGDRRGCRLLTSRSGEGLGEGRHDALWHLLNRGPPYRSTGGGPSSRRGSHPPHDREQPVSRPSPPQPTKLPGLDSPVSSAAQRPGPAPPRRTGPSSRAHPPGNTCWRCRPTTRPAADVRTGTEPAMAPSATVACPAWSTCPSSALSSLVILTSRHQRQVPITHLSPPGRCQSSSHR